MKILLREVTVAIAEGLIYQEKSKRILRWYEALSNVLGLNTIEEYKTQISISLLERRYRPKLKELAIENKVKLPKIPSTSETVIAEQLLKQKRVQYNLIKYNALKEYL